MDFPAEPEEPAPVPDGLAGALGAEPTYVGRNRFDYLVEVDTQATVEQSPGYAVSREAGDTRNHRHRAGRDQGF